jgi:proteasome beta subunit
MDAAEDDVATGGPDVARKIYPNVLAVTATGADDVPEDEVAAAVSSILEERAR